MNLSSLIRKSPSAAPYLAAVPVREISIPQEEEEAPVHASSGLFDVVRNWASRSRVLCRIIDSAKSEIGFVSRDMEVETAGVVGAFKDVAGKARSQSERISDLASLATRVSVDGQEVEIGVMATLFDESLNDILSKIESLSRQAVSMVGVLDGMSKGLDQVEQCIGQVEAINRQANILAVNARIEAARSGAASGAAFGVVANEIGQLSHTTKSLSETMRLHIGEIVSVIRDSHDALLKVATLDMSADIEKKHKLDRLVGAMVERNSSLGRIVTEAAADQEQISRRIDQIITGMQFQDRVSQRLEQVLDTLSVLGDAVSELEQESGDLAPGDITDRTQDVAWLKGLSARYKLSEMRARFVARVIDGDGAGGASAVEESKPAEAGSIELF